MKNTYIIFIPKDNADSAEIWCREQFGERWEPFDNRTGVWCSFWAGKDKRNHFKFLFENEQDASAFALRWV